MRKLIAAREAVEASEDVSGDYFVNSWAGEIKVSLVCTLSVGRLAIEQKKKKLDAATD